MSVQYADKLRIGLPNWLRGGFASAWGASGNLTVVTTPWDAETMALCSPQINTAVYRTNAFYEDGATFNKGRAIVKAVEACGLGEDWVLLFDADIEPPPDWLAQVIAADPQPGTIYGARRVQAEGGVIPDGEPAGYFLLFHSSDAGARVRPFTDTQWTHAGCYDSTFLARWPRDKQAWLPFTVTHHGLPGTNWFGVGNDHLMRAMVRERAERGGYRHETVGWVPKVD